MTIRQYAHAALASLTWSTAAVVVWEQALAQGCRPVGERVGDRMGCWILVEESLGKLPQKPLFWFLANYPTREEANMVKGPQGTVIDAFQKVWLSTIAESGWQPAGGVRVAEILPASP